MALKRVRCWHSWFRDDALMFRSVLKVTPPSIFTLSDMESYMRFGLTVLRLESLRAMRASAFAVVHCLMEMHMRESATIY